MLYETWRSICNRLILLLKADLCCAVFISDFLGTLPPWLDIALLELAEHPEGIHPCRLSGKPPAELTKRTIAVVGYPAMDARSDIADTQRIFEGIYQVKRLMPGRLMGSPSSSDQIITHDASTLGGTGGAPVIDIETGEILGIHYAGLPGSNYAVSAWELARDPWVYSHSIERSDNVLPAWHEVLTDSVTAPNPNNIDEPKIELLGK
ncbi:MAG: serine protease [Candidatus Electrothrix sp. GM3_4]|nr:serine protease [Candidatus Electrothrix sp. GM3_4]